MKVFYLTLPALLDVSLCLAEQLVSQTKLRILVLVGSESDKLAFLPDFEDKKRSGIFPLKSENKDNPVFLQNLIKRSDGFDVSFFGNHSGFSIKSIRTAIQVLKMIRLNQPDVIHFETTSGRMLWVLPWLKRIAPVVITVHDPQPHTGEKPLKKLLIRFLTYRNVDRFILHNQSQISEFCREYQISADKIDHMPLGEYCIYRNYPDSHSDGDGQVVLFFGRLSPYKGLEVLLKAIPLVSKQVNNVRFIIAGKPIPGYQLPQIPAIDNGCQIELINGYVSVDRLAQLFSQATLTVCPYTDATQSGVIMTSYAFRKPVIASNVGGIPEYVQNDLTGILVPPSDVEALTNALISGLTRLQQPEQYEYMAASIQQVCKEKFNWQKISELTLQTYLTAIADRKDSQ